MIVERMTDLIGNTPMFRLKMANTGWRIYLKLEKFNPGGSMKDRMAYNMIMEAEERGSLKRGGTIIESSSGNTAIGLAIVSAIRGYNFVAVVDHHASSEKVNLIKALGGRIVLVGDGYKDNEVAVIEREKTAQRLSEEIPNSLFLNQANNFDNRSAYINTLADELVRELGEIDELFAAIGTGGSACGTAIGLKKLNSKTRINVVEPEGSIIFGGEGKPYYQSGTGNPKYAEIPKIIDYALIDKNFYASDIEAFNTCRYIARRYGLLIGGSSGGVLYKGLQELNIRKGSGTAVILLCDGGEKYLHNIFNDNWMNERNLIDERICSDLKSWLKEE